MDTNGMLRTLGMLLLLIGIIILAGFGIYSLLAVVLSSEAGLIIKLSIIALVIGFILLLLSLIKERVGTKDQETERRY